MNKGKYIDQYRPGKCDKCGQQVSKENSARLVQEIANGKFVGWVVDRHLYPIESCEGSPSRVALISEESEWAEAYDMIKERRE